MNRVISVLAGLAASAALASGTPALAKTAASSTPEGIANPTGVVPSFDIDQIGPVLTDLGVVWQARRSQSGVDYIEAAIGGDFVFKVIPAACADPRAATGCVGANFVALYKAASINYQTVAAFNQQYAFTTAGVLPGGRDAYISRYEIADFGIARGNIASSLGSFVYLADRFRAEVAGGRMTVSQEGYAGDMAARYLNARAGGGPEANGMTSAARHQAAFEETAELVRMLSEDDRALANKITNNPGR